MASSVILIQDTLGAAGSLMAVAKSIYTQNQEILQALLRQARSDANLSQWDLANRLGRPQSFVSKIESGERLLDLVELREVCTAMGTTLHEFVTRFENAINDPQSSLS